MSIDQDSRPGLAAELEAAPDAALVALLEGIDPATLTGEDLAAYVHARWRVHNRAEAQLLEGLHHLGRAEAGRTARRSDLDEFSGDELCGLLGWSRTMATRRLDLADELFVRLPEVGDALHEGLIDEPKARTICEWTGDLTDDHAHHVCGVVLSEAPELPVSGLRERIEKIAVSLDPDWAERRRRRAESRARVILSANPSGTATLSFVDAPAPDGIASQARIDALAAAIRHLGVLTPINALRLHVGMRLLDGSTEGMDDRAIALLLASEYHAANTPVADDGGPEDGGSDDGGPDDGGPDDGGTSDDDPRDSGRGDSGPDDGGPDDDGPEDSGPDGGPEDGGGPDDDSEDGPRGPSDEGVSPDRGEQGVLHLPMPADLPEAPSLDVPDPRPGQMREGTVEVRLRLTTALGLDEHPGSVPGYGTVLAHDARSMILRRLDAEWRVVLTDDDGHLQHVLLARRRPPHPRDRHGARGRRAAIVELQVPTTVLAALRPDDHPDWAPLLVELQRRLTGLGGVSARARPPDADASLDEWARRRPRAELDRWVRVRDRHCLAPMCRRPAHRAELDHTRDHALGGPTASWNLGAYCTHDHRCKHVAGWKVRQPTPGRLVIRTRAGVTHTTEPRPVIEPLPGPRPAARPRPLPHDGWTDVDGRADDGDEPDRFVEAARRLAARRVAVKAPPAPPVDLDDPPPF